MAATSSARQTSWMRWRRTRRICGQILKLSGGVPHRRSRPLQIGPARLAPGFLPELVDVVGAGSLEQGGGRFAHLLSRQGHRLAADELEGAWSRLSVHAQVAQQPGYEGYLGVEAAMARRGMDARGNSNMRSLLLRWRHGGRSSWTRRSWRLMCTVHDRRRLCYRATKGSKSSVAWVTAWPSPAVSMPPDSLAVCDGGMVCRRGATPAVAPHRLATAELRSKGREWGVVDGHGVAVCCARMDGALRTCHDAVKHTIARSAVDAGFRVWRRRCMECPLALCVRQPDRRRMGAYSVREKQGLVPDLQLDDSHYELKGIRSCGQARALITNYNGGVRSTGFSTERCRQEGAEHC
jgi:hypothetical protein